MGGPETWKREKKKEEHEERGEHNKATKRDQRRRKNVINVQPTAKPIRAEGEGQKKMARRTRRKNSRTSKKTELGKRRIATGRSGRNYAYRNGSEKKRKDDRYSMTYRTAAEER